MPELRCRSPAQRGRSGKEGRSGHRGKKPISELKLRRGTQAETLFLLDSLTLSCQSLFLFSVYISFVLYICVFSLSLSIYLSLFFVIFVYQIRLVCLCFSKPLPHDCLHIYVLLTLFILRTYCTLSFSSSLSLSICLSLSLLSIYVAYSLTQILHICLCPFK